MLEFDHILDHFFYNLTLVQQLAVSWVSILLENAEVMEKLIWRAEQYKKEEMKNRKKYTFKTVSKSLDASPAVLLIWSTF